MKTFWLIGIIIAVSSLFYPYVWECFNDRNGDPNKKIDVLYRAALMLFAGILCHIFIGVMFYKGAILSGAIHFQLFDYTIAYILIKRKIIETPGATWYNTLGKKGTIDSLNIWKRFSPHARMIVRVCVSASALTLFLW